ncbi:MAG: glycine--tRNA ligase subunit beta [Syntrophales bacterium]|nr:glycine--tRNA ligase subunit beta [Syntrophales bacterium]
MAKELLLEVGTEEIPAEFLPKTLKDMEEIIRKDLDANRIGFGRITTMATPRRLVLIVADLEDKQQDQVIEKIGPARRASFDSEGKPTKAAVGFAKGQGIDISELETVTTEKGEYICARKRIQGEQTPVVLPGILSGFILSLPFQKSMRWKDLNIRFVRPIHWIVAMYGGDIVSFKLENITSGRKTCGHRFMSPGFFLVKDGRDYLAKMRDNYVIVNPAERRKMIIEEAARAAADAGGKPLIIDDLLEEVTFLVEYPTAVVGSFDREYLKLPREVLITSMVEHQRYFPVTDGKGALMPYFVTINNTLARDPSVVARGNEKVIRARLADARFFFEEDRKVSLDEHFKKLGKVVFHSLLGTSLDKVDRFQQLAAWIADRIDPSLKPDVERAAHLAKADLETQMVYEFPSLQGVMGREYALLAGEKKEVAEAVFEHYLPTSAGGELPRTEIGAIVSIADKTDTIAGFFGVKQVPTGTADPYALRRQALGVINIILDRDYRLPLDELIGKSLEFLKGRLKRPAEETRAEVLEFFRGRFENRLISQGYPYDVVDAVLARGLADLTVATAKIEAMKEFKVHPDFEPLAIAFKRVCNIIKNAGQGSVDPALFENDAERELYSGFRKIREKAGASIEKGEYGAALTEIAALRKPVDRFFESVLVMAEDERIRKNRLSLLKEISELFFGIADFSRIVTE